MELIDKTMLTALASLIAAFIGAISAFVFNDTLEKKREVKINVDNANSTLVTIFHMAGVLDFIGGSFVNKYREDAFYWLRMPAQPIYGEKERCIDISNLSFLIEFKEPSLLIDIEHLDRSFRQVMDVYRHRLEIFDLHIRPVRDLMIKDLNSMISHAQSEGVNEINFNLDRYVGAIAMKQYINLTDEMIRLNDKARTDFRDKMGQLMDTLDACYPRQRFIKFIFSD